MNARIKYSVLLVGVGIILAFLPFDASRSFRLRPSELLAKSVSEDHFVTVDQVARFLNNEDHTVQLIDLRSAVQFREFNIPGSINIPFSDFSNPVWEAYLNQKEMKNIFYGNGNQTAGYAWVISTGMGFENNFIMKGGLNEWFKTVMLSEFSGDKITPIENARFETRLNARKIFTQINSLPDSLKTQYFNSKRLKEKKLDGGCE
jgi:3-mercaptopyruvate sulfurtransferase SseA